MNEPRWLTAAMVEAMHSEALTIFGGTAGTRSPVLLASALDRPKQLHARRPDAGPFAMAAALCIAICKINVFEDGRKRVALLAANAFLFLNGWAFDPAQTDEVEIMVGVAAGEITEDMLALWLEANSRQA